VPADGVLVLSVVGRGKSASEAPNLGDTSRHHLGMPGEAISTKHTINSVPYVMPSATPSEEEIRIWQALPRDEQLRRLRTVLTHPDCTAVNTASMGEILAEGRARADSHRG
jgi:hypothetical protein